MDDIIEFRISPGKLRFPSRDSVKRKENKENKSRCFLGYLQGYEHPYLVYCSYVQTSYRTIYESSCSCTIIR